MPETEPQKWIEYLGKVIAAVFANKESLAIVVTLIVSYILHFLRVSGRLTAVFGLFVAGPMFYVLVPINSVVPNSLALPRLLQDVILAYVISMLAFVFQRLILRRVTGKQIYDSNTQIIRKADEKKNDTYTGP